LLLVFWNTIAAPTFVNHTLNFTLGKNFRLLKLFHDFILQFQIKDQLNYSSYFQQTSANDKQPSKHISMNSITLLICTKTPPPDFTVYHMNKIIQSMKRESRPEQQKQGQQLNALWNSQ